MAAVQVLKTIKMSQAWSDIYDEGDYAAIPNWVNSHN